MQSPTIPVYRKQKGNLRINDLLTLQRKKGSKGLYKGIEKPHRHDYYSILFLISGQTTQFIDFNPYTVSEPTVLLMHPDQVHYEVETKNAEIILITFKAGLLLDNKDSFEWKDIFTHTQVALDESAKSELLSFIALLETEYQKETASEKILAFLLSALLEKIRLLSGRDSNQEESGTRRILKAYKGLIERYALEEEKVSFYAKKLFISPGHLNDTVKKMTGRTAKSLITQRQLLEAKRLLFWTENSIQEVAWKTGFKDPAYFTRFFKKHTGLLPGEFQRKTRAELGEF